MQDCATCIYQVYQYVFSAILVSYISVCAFSTLIVAIPEDAINEPEPEDDNNDERISRKLPLAVYM